MIPMPHLPRPAANRSPHPNRRKTHQPISAAFSAHTGRKTGKSVADFAARRRQIILIINRRDMRVAIYSSRAAVHRRGITIGAPVRARQSCPFLETGSLYPPPAALRRFPCAPAARALQRSASPSKKEDGEYRPLFLKPLGKRRGDDRHGVNLLGVAAAGEVVDGRVQAEQDRAPIGVSGMRALAFSQALRILSTSSPLPEPRVE